MSDETTTVAHLKQVWARFVAERDWNQFHSPKNLSMALAVEAAELMEHFLWMENEASHTLTHNPRHREQVMDELADVAGVIFALCNALDVDLTQAITQKMKKNELKYPVDKARGRYRLDD